jgi:hypothetical protein
MNVTVHQWLQELGLAQYAGAFEANDIDMELLAQVNDQVLKDIGVTSAGHRLRICNAIAKLKPDSATVVPEGTVVSKAEVPVTSAERRQLTVMFCDLVGSTELATKLDPEQLRDLMQAYQRACGEVISRYEGHVAQYLGDGLMVYFGWPTAHEDDASRAIRAGLEITEAVPKLNAVKGRPNFLSCGHLKFPTLGWSTDDRSGLLGSDQPGFELVLEPRGVAADVHRDCMVQYSV